MTALITLEPRYQKLIQEWEGLWGLEDVPQSRWLLPSAPALTPIVSGRYPLTQYFRDMEMQFRGQAEILMWREKDIHFEDTFAYVEHILRTKTHNRGLLILVMPDADGSEIDGVPVFAGRVNQLLEQDALT
jgi:hypothetical protein